MPSSITKGSRVWANIGPLQEGSAPRPDLSTGTTARKKRRTRIRLHGTVIQSCGSPPNNLWRVYWDGCGKTSDHRPITLHIDNGARPSQMSPEAVEQQLNQWLNMPGIYVGGHDEMMCWTATNFRTTTTLSATPHVSATGPRLPHTVIAAGPPLPPRTVIAAVPPLPRTIIAAAPPLSRPPRPHADDNDTDVPSLGTNNEMPPLDPPNPGDDEDSDDGDDTDNPPPLGTPFDDNLVSDAFDPNEVEREYSHDTSSMDHALRTAAYLREKNALVNDGHQEVVVGPRAARTTWTVIEDILEADVEPTVKQFKEPGQVLDFEFGSANRTVRDRSRKYSRINFLALLRHLWPGCETEQLEKMNKQLEIENEANKGRRKRTVRKITKSELWKFFGMMICSRLYGGENGEKMWDTNTVEEGLKSTMPKFNPGQWMSRGRFQEIKRYIPLMFSSEQKKSEDDPWWKISQLMDDFNSNRKQTIATSNL